MPVRIDRLWFLSLTIGVVFAISARAESADRVLEHRRAETARTFVAVMGAVRQPGVYELSSAEPPLWELVDRSGGLSPQARGIIRIVRHGRVAVHTHVATGMRTVLNPGDVVVIPAPRQRKPNAVEVALVGLLDRPVVLRLRPQHANVPRLVELLEQSRTAESAVRVGGVPGNRVHAPAIPQYGVLTFDPRTIARDRLPQLPPPVLLKQKPAKTAASQPPPGSGVVRASADGRNDSDHDRVRTLFTVPPPDAESAGATTQVAPDRTGATRVPEVRDPGPSAPTGQTGEFRSPIERSAIPGTNAPIDPGGPAAEGAVRNATAGADADLAAKADAREPVAADSKAAIDPLTMVVAIFAAFGVLSAAVMLWSMGRRAMVGPSETPATTPQTGALRTRLQRLLANEMDIREENIVLPSPLEFFGTPGGRPMLRSDTVEPIGPPHFAPAPRETATAGWGPASALRSDPAEAAPPQPAMARSAGFPQAAGPAPDSRTVSEEVR